MYPGGDLPALSFFPQWQLHIPEYMGRCLLDSSWHCASLWTTVLTTFCNISQHFTTISTMTEIYFTDMFHCMTHMFHGIHGTQAVVIKLHGAQLESPEHHYSNSGCRDTLQIGSKYSNHIEQFQSKTTGPEVFTQRWSCHHPKTEGFNLLSRAYNTT